MAVAPDPNPSSASKALDPALLDRIRRGFPLRMDALGRLLFEEDEITHPGVIRLFRRGIDLSDKGELIVRVESQWTFLNASDCPLRVIRVDGDHTQGELPRLHLDDTRVLELDPHSLVEDEGRGLRCTVPSQGRARPLHARFSNRAALELSEWLNIDEDGNAALLYQGRAIVVGRS